MQGSKHSARRLLLAGAATALVLVGCEGQQQQFAERSQQTATKSKSEGEK
jgi:hypothetical protein